MSDDDDFRPNVTVSQVQLNINPDSNRGFAVPKSPTSTASKPTQSPGPLSEEDEEPEDEIVKIENVTVKFRLSPVQVIAQVYPNCMTLGEVKTDISRRFEVPAVYLILTQGSATLSDECRIRETDSDEFGIHEYNLILEVPEIDLDPRRTYMEGQIPSYKLDLEVYYSKHRLPDFIEVHISPENSRTGKEKNIVVEIQNRAITKPFLCGYLDRETGVEYLDAFTQTGPFVNKCKFQDYASRDTQTFEHKSKHVDTMHDQMAQCWLDGNNVRYYSEATDYCISPRKYVYHYQIEKQADKLNKIRLIQRNFRRYKWMKWMRECAKQFRIVVANRVEEEKKFLAGQERAIKREQRSKQFPRTRDDFELLFGEVQKWKMAELKRIGQMYEGAARVAEVNILLDKEIQLLNGIEQQRQLVNLAMKDFRQDQLLQKMGEPIKWIGYNDTIIHLDLLRTQRVRFLTSLYKDLQKPLPKEERLELITKVREVLLANQEFPEFGELFDLFDRERNLLVYAKHCDVEILRKRQNIVFMELIKYDREPKQHNKDVRMCLVCQQIKSYSQFAIRTRQYEVDTCKKCYYLKVTSMDNVVYTAILRAIQRDERKKHCSNSFAFIMQVDDIRHMIDQIWHGHSILSKCEDLKRLRLPRWDRSEEWSPWNCICLTETEVVNHNRVEDLKQVYDLKTRLEVGNRHMLARNAFHNLAEVSVEFTEIGKWWTLGLNKQRKVRLEDLTSKKGISAIPQQHVQNDFNYKMGKIL